MKQNIDLFHRLELQNDQKYFNPFIAFILIGIIYTSTRTPDVFLTNDSKMIGDYNFENVTISLLKNGTKEWELTARQSTIFDNSQKVLPG